MTIFVHPSTTTIITRLPPPSPSTSTVVVFTHVYSTTTVHVPRPPSTPSPTALTTTVTTHIQSTTTTTLTISFSPSTAPSSSTALPLDGSANTIQTPQNSSCTCLTPGAWCGTRSAMEVAINGTCNWNSLYMCKVDESQSPLEFNCTEVLQPIFGIQAGAGCMEGNAGLNDVCIMPKNGTS